MLESRSAASVSPNLSFTLANDCTLTFNFQPDGQVVLIAVQRGNTVVGALSTEQVIRLRDTLATFIEKRSS